MTWILIHQSGFGPYFPDGEFTDRNEKMKDEFDRVATEDMKANYDGAFHSFRSSNRIHFDRAKAPAKPFQQVKRFQLDSPQKQLADVLKVTNRLTVVSAAVMEIVRAAEPDAVQFWPVDILTKRGEPASETNYFAMLVMNMRDGFRPDASGEGSCRESWGGSNQWHIATHKKAFLTGVAIEKEKTSGARVWHEERVLTSALFFSDELAAKLKDGKFRLPPKFYQCISV